MSPVGMRHALIRSEPSAPNTQLGVAADRVRAADLLGPGDRAELRVDATDRGLERACADEIADAHDRADQVSEALDLVGAARRAKRRPPSGPSRSSDRSPPCAAPGQRSACS